MRLDRSGAALSASYEAMYLFTYPDPATEGEPWTSGIGHTKAAGGFAPRPGQLFTMRQVVDQYRQDMGRVETRVNKAFKREQSQIDFNVWCSFDLNTGAISSGTVDDLVNAGNRGAAIEKIGEYIRAAGKVNRGLQNRRASEQAILRTGKYPPIKILVHDRPGSAVRYISADAFPWDVEPLAVDVTFPDLSATPSVPLPVKGKENFIIDLAKAFWSWARK